MKENRMNSTNRSADLMIGKLQEILTDTLKKQPTYSGAIVSSLNPDNTVNVYIPPNNKVIFTRISNQTSFPLAVGDCVELLLKDGSYSNCWIVAKHGVSFNETITDSETQELDASGKKITGGSSGGSIDGEDYVTYNELIEYYLTKEDAGNTYVDKSDLTQNVMNIVNSMMPSLLADYAKKSDLSNYITSNELNNILSSYATSSQVSQQISQVSQQVSQLETSVNNKLNDYVTKTELNTILQDYVKKDEQSNGDDT